MTTVLIAALIIGTAAVLCLATLWAQPIDQDSENM